MWDLIVSAPDHCLSFYSECMFCNILLTAICMIIRNDTSVAQLVMFLIRNRCN